jgi:hypothetical protein
VNPRKFDEGRDFSPALSIILDGLEILARTRRMENLRNGEMEKFDGKGRAGSLSGESIGAAAGRFACDAALRNPFRCFIFEFWIIGGSSVAQESTRILGMHFVSGHTSRIGSFPFSVRLAAAGNEIFSREITSPTSASDATRRT